MRKAQAALEFLTTYGWAFLVILVMIGALAYFGVLNPSNLLPPRCMFSPEIQCLEHQIRGNVGGNGYLAFRVRNNVGQMASFTFNATDVATNEGCTSVGIIGGGTDIKAGRIMVVNCTFPSTLPVGDRRKFEVSLNYTKSGGAYTTPVKGEIYGEIQ
jgi:hypothetical protein